MLRNTICSLDKIRGSITNAMEKRDNQNLFTGKASNITRWIQESKSSS